MSADQQENSTTQRRSSKRAAKQAGEKSHAACLVVIHGERLGQRLELLDQVVVIGRSPDSDFHIPHRSVSRSHCRIWREPSGYRIKDLESTNKTFLNEQPIIEAELKDGDHIAVGESVLKFMEQSSIEARYHEELYQLATQDPLTELNNRRHFQGLLEKELSRARKHDRVLSLLLVDIDHFKAINDRYGHPAGDLVIKEIAETLRQRVHEEQICARIGGEEFAVVLPEQDEAEAIQFAEQLRLAVAALSIVIEGVAQKVTISIGIAQWRPTMGGMSELLRSADLQLYRAKQGGRNCVAPPIA